MDLIEFESLIEFQLANLSARNQHHRFEQLCVELARRRIAANIRLATGPVGAGGDGGRDGESFETDLPYEAATWFSVRATAVTTIIACSTRVDFAAKIRSDIRKIGSSTGVPSPIVFLSTQSIPFGISTALQHELGSPDRTIAIWDRSAISNALVEPDLRWIAREYLDIPAELIDSLQPVDLDWLEDEVKLIPGQPVAEVLEIALALHPVGPQPHSAEVRTLHRKYVALHLALDGLPLSNQHAYELSRQHDEVAGQLRALNTSSAEALDAYGLLN